MKNYIYALIIAFAAIALSSCNEEEGTDPGTYGSAVVTIYQYPAPKEYNADEATMLRIVPNNRVKKMYVYTELLADKEAYIAANGKRAYNEWVIEKGTEYAEVSGAVDVVIENLRGLNATTVVAVEANGKGTATESLFKGVIWVDAGQAMVYQNIAHDGASYYAGKVAAQRQSDANIFRVKDMFYQIENSLGNSIASSVTFTFNDAKECTAFASSKGAFVIVNFVDGDKLMHGYYDPVDFGTYCSVAMDEDEEGIFVAVSLLGVDDNTGDLYTGRYILLYINELEWFE